MKKIGILFGMENTFPQAFVERVNSKNVKGVTAEPVSIEMVQQGKATDYAVIIDRISQDVPFYRAMLKNAAICGTAVINNPFWWSADEKFFNNSLAMSVGVPVPKTVLLPSKERPDDTTEKSFRNLKMMDWDSILEYVGSYPVWMKPHSGGGWKSVYKINNRQELFAAYDETGQLVMMLQEGIEFDQYFRCYALDKGKYLHIMPYEPRNPHHLRYVQDAPPTDPKLLATMQDYLVRLNEGLGYDFNTVEFAVKDGIPYAIDFCNPAPDAELSSVGQANFDWIVENAANMAIEKALAHKDGQMNLTWGNFVKKSLGTPAPSQASATQQPKAKKSTPTKKTKTAKVAKAKKSAKVLEIDTTPVKETLSGAAATKAKKTLLGAIGKGSASKKDDLKQIKGVGPKLEKILNDFGIYNFEQVSKMKAKEYDLVDSLLSAFKGRGKRDDWAGQAKKLK